MNKSPPRKEIFIQEMKRFADDDSYGYSQKPPSGRWGPDYDCSSLIYQAAQNAGYEVGAGGDKVRFTGTMLKDFEKAGFQILPFANVGISDLKIGDVLLNLALHAEVYIGEDQSVGATSSEDGTFVGKAGDQTGREIERHPVITFDKDWDYVLRPPDEDQNDKTEEGDEEVPMYNQPNQGGYNPTTYNPQGYQQGYQGMNGMRQNMGYPQGNLGQMNGYSQANAGGYGGMQGYPQGMGNDLQFVMGIEGAKNFRGAPNSRMALFDEDKPLMYIVGYDQQGNCNDIHVYQFEECSEEMPQHLSPLMQHGGQMGGMASQAQQGLTREDIMEMIKECLNESTSPSTNPTQSNGGSNGGQSASATAGRSR